MKLYKTTMNNLFNISNRLHEMSEMPFSKKGAFCIYRNVNKINEELKDYITKRDELINQYGENGSINPQNPKWNEFINELNQIGSVETEININTICIDDLPNEITLKEIDVLDFMIEDEE